MAVRTKNRRRLHYGGELYVWYVKPDEDFWDKLVLHIISSDKKLILAYPLNNVTPYVVSKGRIFQGHCYHSWHRYLLPKLEGVTDVAATPSLVTTLIEWATVGENAVQVEWDGKEFFL